jgi:hypothetical protein
VSDGPGLEVVVVGGPYFAGLVLRNFVLGMFIAALALAVGPASLGNVDLWMAKVLARRANEHDAAAAAAASLQHAIGAVQVLAYQKRVGRCLEGDFPRSSESLLS